MRLIRFIFPFLINLSLIQADQTITLDLTQPKTALQEKLTAAIKEPFLLTGLSLRSDSNFSEKEFLYWSNLKIGQTVAPAQLTDFLEFLYAKDRFKTVKFELIPFKDGLSLNCLLEADWMLGDVTFRGVSLGPNRYLQYYDMQVGERFSEEKHAASLEKLHQAFYQKGYKAFTCKDTVRWDEQFRTVAVKVVCQKGKQFSFDSIQVRLVSTEGESVKHLQEEVQSSLEKSLCQRRYAQDLINGETKKIQDFLIEQGFAKSSIKLQETIDLQLHKVDLQFTIQVGKKRNFTFFGNHFFSDKDLSEMITKFGFSTDMLPASLIAQDIANEYHKKGFWKVTVDEVEYENGATYFVIKEGPRVTVKKVIIKGAEFFNARRLAERYFTRLQNASFFDDEYLKRGVEKLLSFYRQNGFLDAKILKRTYEPIGQSETYTFTITLDEGAQQKVKAVVIEQSPHLCGYGPFAPFNATKRLLPFDKSIIQKQREWLLNYFKKQGYLTVTVEPTLIRDGNLVTIKWVYEKGHKVRFGKTLLKGSSRVDHDTVLNMLALKKGKVWTKNRLQLGYLRLKQLDVFKQIRMYPAQGVGVTSRDVVVYLQDDEPFELRTRIGFQQVSKNFALKKGSTYKVGGTLLWRNPTYHADLLRFDVDATRFERKIDGAYSVPCRLPIPVVATFKGYGNRYTQPLAAGSRKTLYKVTQEGILANFTSQTRHTSTAFTAGFEWMETKDISHELAAAINFKADLISKKIPYFFLEPSIFVDLLDNKMNPKKGLFFAASLKGMFPLKTNAYSVKMLVEKGMFFPLMKNSDIICGARIRFGHIFKETFSKIMPPERFYLGGANSLRGYLPDSCPPLGTFTDDKGAIQRVPQGGKSMVNMNLELRIPLAKQFDWVIFQDFGVLVEDIQSLSYGNNNLASTGFGIRYQTSIGPLRFDIGWKWKKPFPEDAGYAWFLTFGHAF